MPSYVNPSFEHLDLFVKHGISLCTSQGNGQVLLWEGRKIFKLNAVAIKVESGKNEGIYSSCGK